MGCNCGKRRALVGQVVNNLKSGNSNGARQNASRFVKSVQIDARKVGAAIRSTLNIRPPSR